MGVGFLSISAQLFVTHLLCPLMVSSRPPTRVYSCDHVCQHASFRVVTSDDMRFVVGRDDSLEQHPALGHPPHLLCPLVVTDYPQVDMLLVRYRFVNFGAEKSPGSQEW